MKPATLPLPLLLLLVLVAAMASLHRVVVRAETVSLNDALNIAFQKFKSGNMKEARKITDEVISIQPKLAAAHNLLGIINQETNRPNEAIRSFRLAVMLNPNDPEIR